MKLRLRGRLPFVAVRVTQAGASIEIDGKLSIVEHRIGGIFFRQVCDHFFRAAGIPDPGKHQGCRPFKILVLRHGERGLDLSTGFFCIS